MYRHPFNAPLIPTVVEAVIKSDDGDEDHQMSNGFPGFSPCRSIEGNIPNEIPAVATIPRQLKYRASSEEQIPGFTSLVKTKSSFLFEEQRRELQEQLDFPRGLANELGKTRSLFPARFWILDNSGSMLNNDGATFKRGTRVTCTRWQELEETVVYHAELAAILQATSHFLLLNDPGVRVGPRVFSIADEGKQATQETENVKKIMQQTKPFGATPLTKLLVEIARLISAMEGAMRQKGLQAAVIIATDGLPTSSEGENSDAINNEFISTLAQLQNLPGTSTVVKVGHTIM